MLITGDVSLSQSWSQTSAQPQPAHRICSACISLCCYMPTRRYACAVRLCMRVWSLSGTDPVSCRLDYPLCVLSEAEGADGGYSPCRTPCSSYWFVPSSGGLPYPSVNGLEKVLWLVVCSLHRGGLVDREPPREVGRQRNGTRPGARRTDGVIAEDPATPVRSDERNEA